MVGAFLLTRDIFMEERIPCYYHYLSSHLAPGAIPGASRLIIVAATVLASAVDNPVAAQTPADTAASKVAASAAAVAWVCPSASAVAALAAAVAWVCPSASAVAESAAESAAELVVESAAESVVASGPASAVLTVAYTSRELQPSCHPAPRS